MPGPGGPTVGRVNIRVAPDTSKFRRELGQALETLERTLTVNIPTRIDTKRVARDAARVKADVERQLGDIRVGVDIDSGTASSQLAALTRDRTAEVDVDINRASLARARAAIEGLATGLGRLTAGSAGIGAITGGLSALAAGAAAAVVPLVQLGTALAPAVGILTTLPAIAATGAAALAPLLIAFQGMGDALSAALAGDLEAMEEALEGLAPSAAAFVRQVATLSPQLALLREQVQEGFFAPLVDGVSELGTYLLPLLGQGLHQVSMELGESAAGLLDFLSHRRNAQALSEVFDSTARSLENSRGTMPALIAGLRELTLVGLPFVERFAGGLRESATEFANWATAAAESGRATEWIEGALGVFEQLGDIASNVGGILGSIFSAAGDGGVLTTLEQLTGALDDFFASAEGSEALEGLFEGLSSVGTALAPVLTALAGAIGQLAPPIGRLAEAFGPILTRAIEGLTPALTALEPGLMAVLDGLGEAVDALVDSGALESMGEALSEVLTAVSPLLPVLGELAGVLAGALAEALVALAPGLEILATELADTIGPMLPELSRSFGDLVEAIAPLIPPLVEALIPGLELLPPIIDLLVANFDAWSTTITDITPQLIVIIGWIGTLGTWIVRLAGWVLGLLSTWVRWAGETSQSLRDALRESTERIAEFARNTRAAFTNLLDRVRSIWTSIRIAITAAAAAARDAVIAAFRRLVSGAVERIRALGTAARGMRTLLVAAVSGFGSLLYQAGRNVIIGLQNGIVSKLYDLRNTMSAVAGQVRGALPFSPAKYGPLRDNPPDVAGETIAKMVADGLERGRRIVAQAAGDMAGGAVIEVSSSPWTASDEPAAQVGSRVQAELLMRLLEAIREMRGDTVLKVDSQEIARAVHRGNRQLERR
ncbi:hypothetical protein ABZ249_25305 [Nocardiopsis sp. NPDC006139]|uniref:hypothetical protein n=1 Tax=Nocardiopsis sp. NPDC006139 TaxID=3154578 RepID=UPI0033B22F55